MTNSGVLNTQPWRTRLGACCPLSAFLGTSVHGASAGTMLPTFVPPVPRVRGKVAMAFPVPQSAVVMAHVGQTNNYIDTTSAYALGDGASGPPPYREPA